MFFHLAAHYHGVDECISTLLLTITEWMNVFPELKTPFQVIVFHLLEILIKYRNQMVLQVCYYMLLTRHRIALNFECVLAMIFSIVNVFFSDDILMAISKLKALGNGFAAIPVGKRFLVQSVPGEMTMDHSSVLQQAEVILYRITIRIISWVHFVIHLVNELGLT